MKKMLWLAALMITLPAYASDGTGLSGLGSGWIFGAVVVALVIALIVVSSMKAKLKTATMQHGADNYQESNSLHLTIKQDHYLYTTTTKRKIEKEK